MGYFVTKIKICKLIASANENSNVMTLLGLRVSAVLKRRLLAGVQLHLNPIPRKEDSVQLFENVTLSYVTKFLQMESYNHQN
jgi:hypothetical protein